MAMGKMSVGPMGKMSVGPMGKMSVGPMEKMSVGPMGKVSVGSMEKMAVGPMEKMSVGPMEKMSVGPMEKVSADPMGKMAVGPMGKMAVGPMGKMAVGPMCDPLSMITQPLRVTLIQPAKKNMSFGPSKKTTVEISTEVSEPVTKTPAWCLLSSDSSRRKRTHLESERPQSLMSAGILTLHSKVRQQLSANWRRMTMR